MNVNKKIKFSIGIPVFNEAAKIARVLDSVLQQTYDNYEIIVADNSSTDGTQEIVESYANTHACIRYVRHAEDKGAIYNFSILREYATGDYFAWLGGHDYYLEDILCQASDTIQRYPNASLVYAKCVHVDDEGGIIGPRYSDLDSTKCSRAQGMVKVLNNLRKCGNFHGFIPTELVRKVSFELIYGPDDLILFCLAGHGPMVVFDTVVEDMPKGSFPDRPWGVGNNPKTAVWEYLKSHDEFEIDKRIQHKLLITVAPDGFLKRTS